MRALVKTAFGAGNVTLLSREVPPLGPRDVLLRVAAAGVCGTDILILQDRVRIYRPPVILGHNVAGIVAEVGREVTGFASGDRVVVDMNVGACGRCFYCRSQREYLCPGRKGLGYGIDGGMADYLVVGEEWLVRVPDEVSLVEASTLDVCSAIHTLVDRSAVRYGSSVVIFGPGFQGLSLLQVAKLLGASPIILVGFARHAERLELAKRLGADHVVSADQQDVGAAVAALTGGSGADVAFETAGAPAALRDALAVVRRGGSVTTVGSLPDETAIDMHRVVFDEITVRGVRGYTRENVVFYISAVRSGRLNVKPLIGTFSLDEWERAFDARVQRKVIGPVLVP